MRRFSALAGYTLLEMMVVVAIIGILAAIAGPPISEAIRTAREPEDLVGLQNFFNSARITARRLNRCVRVERVSERELKWRTFSDGSATCPTSTYDDLHDELQDTFTLTSKELSLDPFSGVGDDGVLFFVRTGGTRYPQASLIRVRSAATGGSRTLAIMPATGAVRVRR